MTTSTLDRIAAFNYQLDMKLDSALKEKAAIIERLSTNDFTSSFELDSLIEANARFTVAATMKAWMQRAFEENLTEAETMRYIKERATEVVMYAFNPNSTSKTSVALDNATHYEWIRAINDLVHI